MIALYIQTVNRHQQSQRFYCLLNQLETVLDTLTMIAAGGNVLVKIYIVEDGRRTILPPQAFDGQDMTKPLRALQVEWEALLKQSQNRLPSANRHLQLEIMLQRIDLAEMQMAEYDSSVHKLETLIRLTEEQLSLGPRKDRLLNHYQAITSRHSKFMWQAQTHRDELLEELTKLKQFHSI